MSPFLAAAVVFCGLTTVLAQLSTSLSVNDREIVQNRARNAVSKMSSIRDAFFSSQILFDLNQPIGSCNCKKLASMCESSSGWDYAYSLSLLKTCDCALPERFDSSHFDGLDVRHSFFYY